MDSQERVYSKSQATSGPLGSFTANSEHFVEREDTLDILKKTAASLLSFNSPNTFSMVHSSNNPDTQEEVDKILNAHFYPLNLASTQSVVAFLLLTCFVLKKQTREAETLKKLYEDHISLLKDKNTELEDKLVRSESSTASDVGGKMSPDCSSMSPTMSSASSQDCVRCVQLKERVEVLTGQVAQLQRSYDEVCHVNSQWAQDYETLSKQIRNATGFHSAPDSLPSSVGSTSMHTSSSPPSEAVVNHTHSGGDAQCVRCSIYKSQLEDSVQEVEDLRAQGVGLREDIKDCKERLSQKQQEMRCLENEYQILRIQVQEIGDLQLALNMKQEYRKMQRNLQQKTKLYQDAMCEKLDLQKQVEKLRQAFLKCFPIPAPLQAAAPPTTMNSRPPPSGSYFSFPLHSCRNNLQSSSVDSNPPTPPGLLARGDMKGAIVEKDDQMVPRIKLDRDQHPSSSRIGRPTYSMQSRSLEHLDIVQDPSTRGRSLPETGKGPQCGQSISLSPGALRLSDLALNNGFDGTYRRADLTASREFMSRARSSNYASHSSGSSSTTTDMVVNGNSPLSGSHSGASMSHSNTAIHYNAPSSLSSLGYGSNDSSTSLDSHSLNHTHRHAPYAARMRGAVPSEMELAHREMPSDMKSNKSQLGRSSSFTTRPSSLSLAPSSSGAQTAANMGGKAQFFYCPNCRKSFSCVGKDSFDSWFEHVKSCSA